MSEDNGPPFPWTPMAPPLPEPTGSRGETGYDKSSVFLARHEAGPEVTNILKNWAVMMCGPRKAAYPLKLCLQVLF